MRFSLSRVVVAAVTMKWKRSPVRFVSFILCLVFTFTTFFGIHHLIATPGVLDHTHIPPQSPPSPPSPLFIFSSLTVQTIPSANLRPSSLLPQLQQTHPPRAPAGMANDDGLPLILRAREDVGPITLLGNNLHRLEPEEHADEQQGQNQQHPRDGRDGSLDTNLPLDRAPHRRGRGRDQEGHGLRDGEGGGHAREARVVGPLALEIVGEFGPISTGHADLKIRGVVRFHDDAVALSDGQVGEEPDEAGEQGGYDEWDVLATERERQGESCEWEQDHERCSPNHVRTSGEPLLECHAVGARGLDSRTAV